VIELYAITDHPGPPLPDLGPLHAVASGDLAAVCAPAGEGEVTAERLWSHERVVEALMRDRDVLPVRYGTRVAGNTDAAQALQARHDQLAEALEFVRGAVEVAVRAAVAGGSPSPKRTPARPGSGSGSSSGSGSEYLRARAHDVTARERAARVVHEPLAALARAHSLRPPSLSGELLCAAYLVDRAGLDGFVARLAELQRGNAELAISCTGPWPPYSFAER
jgi:hypothetical protein